MHLADQQYKVLITVFIDRVEVQTERTKS